MTGKRGLLRRFVMLCEETTTGGKFSADVHEFQLLLFVGRDALVPIFSLVLRGDGQADGWGVSLSPWCFQVFLPLSFLTQHKALWSVVMAILLFVLLFVRLQPSRT